MQEEKANMSIKVTYDGISICFNDEHLEKAEDLIEVKDNGALNVICIKDEHS